MKFLLLAAAYIVMVSAGPDSIVLDSCTCFEKGNYYSPNSANNCGSFFQWTDYLPKKELRCPAGLQFDVEHCVCSYRFNKTCTPGCPRDYCCGKHSDVPKLKGGLYPYGYSTGDRISPKTLDTCETNYSHPLPIFGRSFSDIFVCPNGFITLGRPLSWYTPRPFPLPFYSAAMLAAYWADSDFRIGGALWSRVTRNACLLRDISLDVNAVYGGDFEGNWALIVTWDRVQPWRTTSSVSNTFQAAVITDGVESYVIYSYKHIEWSSSEIHRHTPAQAGYDAGDRVHHHTIHGSRTSHIEDIENKSNVGVPGKFMFKLSNRPISRPACRDPCNKGGICSNNPGVGFTCTCDAGFSGHTCLTCSV